MQLRQGTHLSKDGTHFKGTDNDRTKVMQKEADECATRLRSFKKKLTVQHEATDSKHAPEALSNVQTYRFRLFT